MSTFKVSNRLLQIMAANMVCFIWNVYPQQDQVYVMTPETPLDLFKEKKK